MKPVRVLVTGAGSAVGQGIIKALRIGCVPVSLVAADIQPMNAALFRADEAVLIPKVENPGALPTLIDLFQKKRIDVVMIGSEFDLMFFAENKKYIENKTGALVIVSPEKTAQIADDKWLTAEFLRERGLPYAPSYLPQNASDAICKAAEWGYPVVLKPRTGTSSRHVYVADSATSLQALLPNVSKPMIQKLIAPLQHGLSNEYTCSVFKTMDDTVLGPFTARRTLHAGHSRIVEVDDYPELHSLLLAIGKELEIMGSLNIQLMVGDDGPVPFEFNARFSGTTAVRAYFGFNEPEMAIRHFFLKEPLKKPDIKRGMAFRYDEEVFVDGVTSQEIREPLPQGKVIPWF